MPEPKVRLGSVPNKTCRTRACIARYEFTRTLAGPPRGQAEYVPGSRVVAPLSYVRAHRQHKLTVCGVASLHIFLDTKSQSGSAFYVASAQPWRFCFKKQTSQSAESRKRPGRRQAELEYRSRGEPSYTHLRMHLDQKKHCLLVDITCSWEACFLQHKHPHVSFAQCCAPHRDYLFLSIIKLTKSILIEASKPFGS
jgi:hypothetical protein